MDLRQSAIELHFKIITIDYSLKEYTIPENFSMPEDQRSLDRSLK